MKINKEILNNQGKTFLDELEKELNKSTDPHDISKDVFEFIENYIDYERITLDLVGEAIPEKQPSKSDIDNRMYGTLVRSAFAKSGYEVVRSQPPVAADGFLWAIATKGEPVFIPHVKKPVSLSVSLSEWLLAKLKAEESKRQALENEYWYDSIVSWIALPLIHGKILVGLIFISHSNDSLRVFSPKETVLFIEILHQAANMIAAALHNALQNRNRDFIKKIINECIYQQYDMHSMLKSICLKVERLLTPEIRCAFFKTVKDIDAHVINAVYWLEDYREVKKPSFQQGNGIAGLVLEKGESQLVDNTQNFDQYAQRETHLKSLLVVPLKIAERIVGLISLDSIYPSRFSRYEQILIEDIAQIIAPIIEKTELIELIQQSGEDLNDPQKPLTDLLKHIVKKAFEITDAVSVALYQFNTATASQQNPEIEERISYPEHFHHPPPRLEPAASTTLAVLEQMNVVEFSDKTQMSNFINPVLIEAGINVVLGVPLVIKSTNGTYQALGILFVNRQEKSFSAGEKFALQIFAEYAAFAMRNQGFFEEKTQWAKTLVQLNRSVEKIIRAANKNDVNKVLAEIARQAQDLSEAKYSYVGMLKEGTRILQFKAIHPKHFMDNLKKDVGEINIDEINIRFDGKIGVAGLAIREAKTFLINDLSKTEGLSKDEQAALSQYIAWSPTNEIILSELAVPIKGIDGRDVIGVINVEDVHKHTFTENKRQVVELLAGHAALAIQQVSSRAEKDDRQNKLHQINALINRLISTSSRDIRDKLRSALEEIADALGAWQVHVYQMTGGVETIAESPKWTSSEDDPNRFDIRQEGVTQKVFRTGELHAIPNIKEARDENKGSINDNLPENGSFVCYPLKARGGRCVGVLWLVFNEVREEFTEQELTSYALFANVITLLITKDHHHPVWEDPFYDQKYKSDIFFIMPFEDGFKDTYLSLKQKLGEKLKKQVSVKYADHPISNMMIMKEIWSFIYHADMIIAECTEHNANVFYELGLAHTSGKRTFVITQDVKKLPFDIQGNRAIEYSKDNLDDLVDKLAEAYLSSG